MGRALATRQTSRTGSHARQKQGIFASTQLSKVRRKRGRTRHTQSTAHKPCEGTDVPVIMLQLACVRSLPSAAPRCIHGAPTVQVTASTCDHRRTPAAREPLSGQLRPSAAPASHHRGRGRGRHSSTAESMASSVVVSVPPIVQPVSCCIPPSASLARRREALAGLIVGCSRSVRGTWSMIADFDLVNSHDECDGRTHRGTPSHM